MNTQPPTDYAALTGRLALLVPSEFYETPETDVEEALALLVCSYYESKKTEAYERYEAIKKTKKP